jgi:Golgi phosphoprotein 3 (GPP34)
VELLICEEMLLLALDNEKGGTSWLGGWTALSGGVLVDALAAGAVTAEGERLRPGAEVDHPLLRGARAAVAAQEEPLTLTEWVQRLPGDLDPFLEAVAARLVETGVLVERRTKVLGLFPTTRFPEADPGPEQELRARLRSVLVDGAEPDAHDLPLIALVEPAGLLAVAAEDDDRDVRKASRTRAAELAERGRAADGSGAAVQAVAAVGHSAVLGSVAATTAATTVTPSA